MEENHKNPPEIIQADAGNVGILAGTEWRNRRVLVPET